MYPAIALTQTLKGEIVINNSRVVQDGFYTYELLNFEAMPPVETYVAYSGLPAT